MNDRKLPDYEPMLQSYHQAFATELEAMIRSLPIPEGSRVVEIACGDGAYTSWLAKFVGKSGQVVGLDVSPDYLELASKTFRGTQDSQNIKFVAGSIDALPFLGGSFDAVWCAQSLFSLPEPVDSIRKMAELVRSGGLVAVLEDDSVHQVLLPWPVEIELAIRTAEWEALQQESSHPDKFYVGRRLISVFRDAGLVELEVRSFATTRLGPLDDPTRKFLEFYLSKLRERVEDRLKPEIKTVFARLIDPKSDEFMINQTDFFFTMIDYVVQGRLP